MTVKSIILGPITIDKVFIEDFLGGSKLAAITSAVISLAEILKIKVIAEGVETESQLQWLKQQNCNLIQGYFMSVPLPRNEFLALLRSHSNVLTQHKPLAVVAN